MVGEHERMSTGGFYAKISLAYDAAIAQEKNGRPFGIDSLREIQLSKPDVLDVLDRARSQFGTEDWKVLLLRSIGIEPEGLSERAKDAFLLRMVPFVKRIMSRRTTLAAWSWKGGPGGPLSTRMATRSRSIRGASW